MKYGFYSREQKRLAVINLVTDFPFEYRIAEIERWSGLCSSGIRRLDDMLGLDVKRGNVGRASRMQRRISVPFKDYIVYGKMKKDSTRKQIDTMLSMQD